MLATTLALVGGLLVLVSADRNEYSGPTSTVKPEKPLFVPSISNPTAVHSTMYDTGRLEGAAYSTPYGHNNAAVYEFSDLLQKQPSYQPFERILQNFLHHRGENRRLPENSNPTDEDDYKRKANNVLFSEQMSPEFEDLDRKYKRSTTYVSWNPSQGRAPTTNFGENRAPIMNSRAVDGRPFPYTTWSPYYDAPAKNTNFARRRRHDSEGNDNNDNDNDDRTTPYLPQYAPAYKAYTMYPQFEPYHVRLVRDMPLQLQYPVIYDPIAAHQNTDNLALLTNSLNANPVPADEFERFLIPY